MTNPPKLYQEWFRKADEDEKSVKAILQHGSPSTTCFLSQQIAEKYLKGLVVFHNQSFRKIHDLLVLETILLEFAPEVKSLHADLQLLNHYYIETRYPGNFPDFTDSEAADAYEAARRVKDFVLKQINE
jgi:HEPN domain-containing protein